MSHGILVPNAGIATTFLHLHHMKRILPFSALIVFLLGIAVADAGSLSPLASPAATSYTLTNIYTRLTTNATATESSHAFAPSGSPTATLYTLKQIYNAVPTINATKVLSGTTYLGIAGSAYGDTNSGYVLGTATVPGTALKNLFSGSGQGIAGGSQANGGVDDYNNGGSPAASRYTGGWTTCTVDNNYCSTGLASAEVKDNSTGLIWSRPCNGAGCASFSFSSPLTYTWSSGGGNNSSKTASQLCSSGSHGESGWSLPHQKQLMQAYIDGSYNNIEPSSHVYWTATTASISADYAFSGYLVFGYVTFENKTTANSVRCVR